MKMTDIKIMESKGYKILELVQLYKEIDSKTLRDSTGVSKHYVPDVLNNVIAKNFVIKEVKPGRVIIYKWNTLLSPLDVYKQLPGIGRKTKRELPTKAEAPLLESMIKRLSEAIEIKVSGRIEIVFKLEVGK